MRKKHNTITPTAFQKRVYRNYIQNGGNKGKAILEAGGTLATARNPHITWRAKGFQMLFEAIISDDDLVKRHKELLDKQEIATVTKRGEIIYSGQQHSDVKNALDLAYKLKGAYGEGGTQNNFFIFNEEQRKLIARRILSRSGGGEEPSG